MQGDRWGLQWRYKEEMRGLWFGAVVFGESGPWEELEMDKTGGERKRGAKICPSPLVNIGGTQPSGEDKRELGVGQRCKVIRLDEFGHVEV